MPVTPEAYAASRAMSTNTRPAKGADPQRVGRMALVLFAAASAAVLGNPGHSGAAKPRAILTLQCPGPQCPYTPPTAVESGAAADMAARINVERAQSARDYLYNGVNTALAALGPASGAQQTVQAAAEWEAANNTLADYGGPQPVGYSYNSGGFAASAANTASIDDVVMHSYGHAGAVLAAAPTEMAVGSACASNGTLYVVELQYNVDQPSWQAGQNRQKVELAENNVYTQSGGTITSVTDSEGTYPAQNVFPQQPIAAGLNAPYATGINWSCYGPQYAAGSAPTSPLPAPVTTIASSGDGQGYYLANAEGAISVHGDASFRGAANGLALARPIVHMQTTADGGGYWMVGGDGGIFNYGDARMEGSLPALGVQVSNIVGLVPTADGDGYWMAGSDGGVFAFGDAGFVGSLPGLGVHVSNVVGVVPTVSGKGYWMVGSDGGVFAFGDAGYLGSLPGLGIHINNVVGIIPTPDDGGYWLVGSDGGVFAFGDAGFVGSLPGLGVHVSNVVAIATPPTGSGYWLAGSDGAVYALGVPFFGSD